MKYPLFSHVSDMFPGPIIRARGAHFVSTTTLHAGGVKHLPLPDGGRGRGRGSRGSGGSGGSGGGEDERGAGGGHGGRMCSRHLRGLLDTGLRPGVDVSDADSPPPCPPVPHIPLPCCSDSPKHPSKAGRCRAL